MSDKLPISVFIIAKNEADRIHRAILSVNGWADEVIVIDSGSTDDTMELSEKLGAKVVFHTWNGYGPQKVFGESLCKNDWVLNIDADEEITPELAVSIQGLFRDNSPNSHLLTPEYIAYRLTIKILFHLEKEPPAFAPSNNPVRLYNKNYCGFKNSIVHDSVAVKKGTPIGKLHGIVLHRCFRDLEHWVGKINFYSTLQAEDFIKNGRKPSIVRIVTEPVLSFFKAYFLRRYFLYGIDGFIGSFLYSYARLLRLAKARELLKRNVDNGRG